MPDRPRSDELKELRRELNDVRAEYEAYRRESLASYRSPTPPDRADFSTQLQGGIADHLRRRSAFRRIEKRVAALEQRLTELEAAERADSFNSAPR